MRVDQKPRRTGVRPSQSPLRHVFAASESKDRKVKMPIYARYGVPYAWLLDPVAHVLEAYALEGGAWREIGRFAGAAPVSVAPFAAVTIRLDDLWAPTE